MRPDSVHCEISFGSVDDVKIVLPETYPDLIRFKTWIFIRILRIWLLFSVYLLPDTIRGCKNVPICDEHASTKMFQVIFEQ